MRKMKKKKPETNPIVNIIATMKLAKALDCTYEEADKKIKDMNKTKIIGGNRNVK
jgi:uncharacterized ubiquitin-like protein YukD